MTKFQFSPRNRWRTGLGSWLLLIASTCFSHAALAAPAVLSQTEAVVRKKQIDDLAYTLNMELPEADQPFRGRAQISFVFHPQKQPLRIDFDEGTVEQILINGQAAAFAYDSKAILIAEKLLKADAKNVVEIAYAHPYSREGMGLYRAQDPTDKRSYVYSKFEPYAANRMFPCFDQPDLKATFQLTVKAPEDWTVVTATRETSVQASGTQKIWEFPATARISTYLVSVIAGPYRIWEDKTFRIPLRLMARQSLAAYMPAEEWFRTTRRGFDFFEDFLGVPYAFGKYDQIAVPDFTSGAMENVAAVTFHENYLIRGTRTLNNDQNLANLILHEMAHMWFGNLVTMTWWDDIWLNESFATFAAYTASAADPRFPGTWLDFFHYKQGGAWADQLVTTHPIVVDVPDTNAGSTMFDMITYNKGGAFLKQLYHVVGDAAFRKGLKTYFTRHAYGNTQVKDFIGAMSEATGRDLQGFARDWLTTAGMNTLRADFSCEAGKIVDFTLVQGAALPEHPTLREHAAGISLYAWEKGEFRLIKNGQATYQGERTPWAAAKGLRCPDLVLTNQGDHDYVKTVLDAKSLKNAVQHLKHLQSPLERGMIWNAIAAMVSDGSIPMGDFVRMMDKNFVAEQDAMLVEVIDTLMNENVLEFLGNMDASPKRTALLQDLKRIYQEKLRAKTTNQDTRVELLYNYLNILMQKGDVTELRRLWSGGDALLKPLIKQDERWRILLALSRAGHKPALDWAQAELKQDGSTRGQQSALRIQAAFPDYERKVQLLGEALQASGKPAAERGAVVGFVFPAVQKSLRMRYAPEFMKNVDKFAVDGDPIIGRLFVYNLTPWACDAASAAMLDELAQKPYRVELKKRILVMRQTNERCMKMAKAL